MNVKMEEKKEKNQLNWKIIVAVMRYEWTVINNIKTGAFGEKMIDSYMNTLYNSEMWRVTCWTKAPVEHLRAVYLIYVVDKILSE